MKKKVHLANFDKTVKKDVAPQINCYKYVSNMLQARDIFC